MESRKQPKFALRSEHQILANHLSGTHAAGPHQTKPKLEPQISDFDDLDVPDPGEICIRCAKVSGECMCEMED